MVTGGSLCTLVLVLSIVVASIAEGQDLGRMPRVGVLTIVPGPTPRTEAFRDELRQLGYVEGKNVSIEWRWAAGKPERFPDLAHDLATVSHVIVAAGPQAIVAAAKATRTIPVIMVAASDPVRLGLITSLAHPGGNVTGNVWEVTPEIFGKQVEILKETVPGLSRLSVLANPTSPGTLESLRAVQVATARLNVKAEVLDIRSADDLSGAFVSAQKAHAGAVLVVPDLLTYALRQSVIELAARYRLPAMYSFEEMVEDGALISYGPSLSNLYRSGARYVDKVLKGTEPNNLPVEQPTKFELAVNLKTARVLGLTISRSVLLRADKVIQ